MRFVLPYDLRVRPDDVMESLLKVPRLDSEHIRSVTETIYNRYQVTFTSIDVKELVMSAGLKIEERYINQCNKCTEEQGSRYI